MIEDHWPLLRLRVRTPRLELRVPAADDLAALADLAAAGIHPPDRQPFVVPWTEAPPAERARSVVQHHWRLMGGWRPEGWALQFAVVVDGQVVGVQDVEASQFAVLREVCTGSWLGAAHQGRGIGTEMRAAVLHLAFAGLGAGHATSSAFEDNPRSLAVSRRLGYVDDGFGLIPGREGARVSRRLRLDRARWQAHRPDLEVTVHGLEPCRPLFGLPG